jgi:hypothetical protein
MNAPAPPPQPDTIIVDAFDDDRFASIETFAERAISLWTSVREAAWRQERETLAIHCPKLRVLTLAAFETVKMLGSSEK